LYEPDRLRTSRFAAAARRAVADTRHVVLLYNDRPADAVYHADCGGHTASADAVWGGPAVDYLVGAKDDVSPATHRPWQFITPSTALRNALDADPRTNTGGRLDALTITRVDDSGRVEAIEIRGRRATTVRGEAFRSIVSRAFGERSLLSTKFSLERQGRDYRFDGSGFGHGVGLCQVGAAARARRGTVPEMIFAAYFPGTRLAELREGRPATIHTPAPFPGLIKSP